MKSGLDSLVGTVANEDVLFLDLDCSLEQSRDMVILRRIELENLPKFARIE